MNTDSNRKSRAQTVDLSRYRVSGYSPGGGIIVRGLWYLTNAIVFSSSLFPFYAPKRALLKLFGARIGPGVVIKPRVNIKYPWRLRIGSHSWVGEGAWIDNLVNVDIGDNVCISQEAYLLTGNHNYKHVQFTLITEPIRIKDGAWVGARATVCPGITMGTSSVLTVGSVLTEDSVENGVYAGNPAKYIRSRVIEAL